jgi:tetratricopeptide (TPR) repeat protein
MEEPLSPEMAESITSAVNAMKENRPADAEAICLNWLSASPGCTHHLRLLSHALMKQNRLDEAEERILFAISLDPDFPQLEEDLGSVLAMKGRYDEAIPHFQKAITQDPVLPTPYKKLGQALIGAGRANEADDVFRLYLERDPSKSAVVEAITRVQEGREKEAIELFRKVLKADPDNVDAMRYLAAAYLKEQKNMGDAEALLRRASQIAPAYVEVLMLLGSVLMERNKYPEAAEAFEKVIKLHPNSDAAWAGLAQSFARSDKIEQAANAFVRAIELNPRVPLVQMSYGHILKTLGDQEKSLTAYREAIRLRPNFGEVYWSMANLKIFKFEDSEVVAMEKQLEDSELEASPEVHFRFALGKAYEDRKDYSKAWHYYDTANKKQRELVKHDPVEVQMKQAQIMDVFSREFLKEQSGNGFDVPDPIFIVGLPRSGSTLIEQILASHSQVEGTAELPFLGKIASTMGRYRSDSVRFPAAVKDFRKQDWLAYGKQYIEMSSTHRTTSATYFTDKLPNNFPLVGLIHLILPNAKIINARRHPIDCCLGNYKQLWGKGQHFTYDVFELADYYREYHKIMSHWHDVLPGKVLDVHYEETVLDLEGQVRKILDYCGLPFEEQCTRFYETDRAIWTASSEQVRQPIYQDALGRWRHYGKDLEFWQEELAPVIEELPEIVKTAGASAT